MLSRRFAAAGAAFLWLAAAGCGDLALGAIEQADVLEVDVQPAGDVEVPEGFRAVQVVEGLTFPSSMDWDDEGRVYVLESHSVPVPGMEPRIFRVDGGRLAVAR